MRPNSTHIKHAQKQKQDYEYVSSKNKNKNKNKTNSSCCRLLDSLCVYMCVRQQAIEQETTKINRGNTKIRYPFWAYERQRNGLKINSIYVWKNSTPIAATATAEAEAVLECVMCVCVCAMNERRRDTGFYVKFHTIVRILCDLKTSLRERRGMCMLCCVLLYYVMLCLCRID